MITRVLKVGITGADVLLWQRFLVGLGFYTARADSNFGPRTAQATARFQLANGLYPDGVVGRLTLAKAMLQGLPTFEEEEEADFPLFPEFAPLGTAGRNAKLGVLVVEPAPTEDNPEAVVEKSGFEKNIRREQVMIAGRARLVAFHQLVIEPFHELLRAWREAGLEEKILSFDGSWVLRYVRGSRTTLSSHAWGSAFDINAAWNGFGRTPATGEGSVLELVPIANQLRWYWGGHFNRKDGMHFEYVG
jgi:hypothetical protein